MFYRNTVQWTDLFGSQPWRRLTISRQATVFRRDQTRSPAGLSLNLLSSSDTQVTGLVFALLLNEKETGHSLKQP
jgi:hypothetical protein